MKSNSGTTIRLSMLIPMCFTLQATAQVTVPNQFEAGTAARAAEVNENFSTLADAIDSIELKEGPPGPRGPAGPPGESGTSYANVQILNLADTSSIVDPGYYVLDQDYTLDRPVLLSIEAANVTLDLRGFTIRIAFAEGITSDQENVTVKNGSIVTDFGGPAVGLGGYNSRIEDIHAEIEDGSVFTIGGSNSRLTNSTGIVKNHGFAVTANSNAIVTGNFFVSNENETVSISGFRTSFTNNTVFCGIGGCGTVDGRHITVANNRFSLTADDAWVEFDVTGDENFLVDNVVFGTGSLGFATVDGERNVVKSNFYLPAQP